MPFQEHRAGPRPSPQVMRGPRFHTQASVVLRGDASHHLSKAAVHRARWTGLAGRSVIVVLINFRTWESGAADLVGRILVDADALAVQFQAQGQIAARFSDEAERGARHYLLLVSP